MVLMWSSLPMMHRASISPCWPMMLLALLQLMLTASGAVVRTLLVPCIEYSDT